MSVLIQSFDVDSGELYDGTWVFSGNISGRYKLVYTYWSSGNIPFIWPGVDHLYVGVSNQASGISYTNCTIDLQGNTLNGFTTTDQVCLKLVQQFAFAMPSEALFDWDFLCEYNSTSNAYILTVNYQPTPSTKVGSMKMKYSDPLSTASGVFDKSVDEETVLLHNGDSHQFILPATHIFEFTPKFLLFVIDESSNLTVSSCLNSEGSIIVATEDIPVTNQVINILTSTRELNIGIYRTNIENSPVPLPLDNTEWYLVFFPE